jgi:hypothetical protein
VAQPPTPTKADVETWGAIVGVVLSTAALIYWPARWIFERLVMNAIAARQRDLRAIVETEFAKEIGQRAEIAEIAHANEDRLVALQAAVEAQGMALREVPRMSSALEHMGEVMSGLSTAVAQLNQNMLHQSAELGRVTGFIEERRRRGRRVDDPPVEGT